MLWCDRIIDLFIILIYVAMTWYFFIFTNHLFVTYYEVQTVYVMETMYDAVVDRVNQWMN
jgi:hypothetical protein